MWREEGGVEEVDRGGGVEVEWGGVEGGRLNGERESEAVCSGMGRGRVRGV